MSSINPEWLDTSGAATYLSMRTDTFRRKVRAGVIPSPSHSIGERSPRWRRSDLDAMMTPSSASSGIDARVEALVASIEAGKGRSRRHLDVKSADSDARRALRARWNTEAAARQQSRVSRGDR